MAFTTLRGLFEGKSLDWPGLPPICFKDRTSPSTTPKTTSTPLFNLSSSSSISKTHEKAEVIAETPRADYQNYLENFVKKVTQLGCGCTSEEKEKALEIMKIHNLVEEVAYKAFADAIVEQNITQDQITEEQSGYILGQIKKEAHKLMYSSSGYWPQRLKYLNPTQVQDVIANVGKIVHDRDTKLTNARYYTVSELLMGLDDHNTMVKEILLGSWFKVKGFCDNEHEHLDQIKSNVDFYATVSAKLGFDLQEELKERKEFWNKYFPGVREGSGPQDTKDKSSDFMNIMEVRNISNGFFSSLFELAPDAKLRDSLDEAQKVAFFGTNECKNFVKKCTVIKEPLIKNSEITGEEFLNQYFPELTLA